MSTPVEQIKERLNIADVVGAYLKLERSGASLRAKCPFHNERTPSFFVSPARGSYYCFGCQAKGDIFSFVQAFEGLDFVGALRVLASRAGVELRRLDPKVQSEHARLYLTLEKAARFFEKTLAGSAEAGEYLAVRGLSPATILAWRVGFAPNDWRSLFEHLLKEGCKPQEMERVGLVKKKEGGAGGDRYYDAFRGRIIFPIVDSASRVIAFSARILPAYDDGKTGKYINSPETPLFSKSEVLYGFDRAKFEVRRRDSAIVVEGQMDLLMAHQAGFVNTVASSGTALTDRQLLRLGRLSQNLLVAFDADSAGEKAAERAIRLALGQGFNVKVIALGEAGKDPAELIAKDPAAWAKEVQEAKHIVDFLLARILEGNGEGREKALRIEKTVLPLIALLPSAVEQSHYIKVISERARLREDALFASFKKVAMPLRAGAAPARSAEPPPKKRAETLLRRLFSLVFLAESEVRQKEAEEWRGRIAGLIGSSYEKARSAFEKEKDSLLAEAEVAYGGVLPGKQEAEELLAALEEEQIDVALARLMEKLAASERAQDREAIARYTKEVQGLSLRRAALTSVRFANR